MPVVFLGLLIVALSALQLALCPPVHPMCSGLASAGMFFGLLGVLIIGAGVAMHFELRNKRRHHIGPTAHCCRADGE